MSEAVIALIEGLVSRSPALATLLHQHRADNFGDVLPHLFFGDLTRLVVREHSRAGSEGNGEDGAVPSEFVRILEESEDAFAAGDEEVCELIAVSFIENLPRRGEEGERVSEELGPTLTAALRNVR